MPPRPVTPGADPSRDVPAGLGVRLDCIQGALASLAEEERRLRRLGFEAPLARCREAKRFWSFLGGLFEVAASEREAAWSGRWDRSS